MKILVLSLLRIGDIVLTAPILRGLRDRFPEAQIDLLINSQFRQIKPLLPYIDEVIPFERDKLQKGLGDFSVPIFDSYDRLNDTIDALNAVKYDWVINLTQNRLSGWLMNLIEAKERTGLCFDHQGRASFGSNWFRYLNYQVDADGEDVFHFADVFRFALGLGDDSSYLFKKSPIVETVKGRAEADSFLKSTIGTDVPFIAIQPLTSDPKKDWGLERYENVIRHLARIQTDAHFAILGAPFEKDRLAPMAERLAADGIRVGLAISTFEGAYSLLRKAKLLLTGDTSIKHLASAARTPIVELSMGSSDLFRTGAYLHGSVIIQSREACAPCGHSAACHRESQFCASRIPVELVAMVVGEVYVNRSFQLKALAEEFKNEAEIFRVECQSSSFWAAYSVTEPFSEAAVARWVDRASRKIWLEGIGRDSVADQIGTESLKLQRLLNLIYPKVTPIQWQTVFADFERQALSVEGRINSFKVGLTYLCGGYEDPRKMKEFVRGLISFRDRIRTSPLLRSYKVALDGVIEDDISPAFTRFRRMTDLINEIEKRTSIHLRLIRGLATAHKSEFDFLKGPEKI
jgi:ADP-heptose:LPS heptosyltransferase